MRAHIEVAEARTAWGPLALLILMCIVKSLRGGLK